MACSIKSSVPLALAVHSRMFLSRATLKHDKVHDMQGKALATLHTLLEVGSSERHVNSARLLDSVKRSLTSLDRRGAPLIRQARATHLFDSLLAGLFHVATGDLELDFASVGYKAVTRLADAQAKFGFFHEPFWHSLLEEGAPKLPAGTAALLLQAYDRVRGLTHQGKWKHEQVLLRALVRRVARMRVFGRADEGLPEAQAARHAGSNANMVAYALRALANTDADDAVKQCSEALQAVVCDALDAANSYTAANIVTAVAELADLRSEHVKQAIVRRLRPRSLDGMNANSVMHLVIAMSDMDLKLAEDDAFALTRRVLSVELGDSELIKVLRCLGPACGKLPAKYVAPLWHQVHRVAPRCDAHSAQSILYALGKAQAAPPAEHEGLAAILAQLRNGAGALQPHAVSHAMAAVREYGSGAPLAADTIAAVAQVALQMLSQSQLGVPQAAAVLAEFGLSGVKLNPQQAELCERKLAAILPKLRSLRLKVYALCSLPVLPAAGAQGSQTRAKICRDLAQQADAQGRYLWLPVLQQAQAAALALTPPVTAESTPEERWLSHTLLLTTCSFAEQLPQADARALLPAIAQLPQESFQRKWLQIGKLLHCLASQSKFSAPEASRLFVALDALCERGLHMRCVPATLTAKLAAAVQRKDHVEIEADVVPALLRALVRFTAYIPDSTFESLQDTLKRVAGAGNDSSQVMQSNLDKLLYWRQSGATSAAPA